MMSVTHVELMVNIEALSTEAKQAISIDQWALCDQLLIQRQGLIEQLVILSDPALCAETHAFLLQVMTDDQDQVMRLNTIKSNIESQQVTTKRSAKSINRYLAIKQF